MSPSKMSLHIPSVFRLDKKSDYYVAINNICQSLLAFFFICRSITLSLTCFFYFGPMLGLFFWRKGFRFRRKAIALTDHYSMAEGFIFLGKFLNRCHLAHASFWMVSLSSDKITVMIIAGMYRAACATHDPL